MMNPKEIETAERYLLGLDRVSEAIERLNDLARGIGVPPITLRFAGEPARLFGELSVSAYVNAKLQNHYIESARCLERRAA